jgi:hypothetical protein
MTGPGDDARLVMTQAVIDGFSYYQLQPNDCARYATTSGTFGERQAVHFAAAIARMPAGSTLVGATDNDDVGEKCRLSSRSQGRPVHLPSREASQLRSRTEPRSPLRRAAVCVRTWFTASTS